MLHRLNDGIDMYFEVHGPSDAATTIVLLNGLSQSTIAWTGILPQLVKDHKVILLDLVFQGRSAAANQFRTYDEHAADVDSLLSSLDVRNVILCGISYGGAVAQHFAVNHPLRLKGLVLVSTFSHKTAHFNAIGDSWVAALKSGGYPLMLDVMLPVVLGEDYFESPLIPIETLKESRVAAQPLPENLLALMKATELREDYREKLRLVNVRSLVVHGEKDLLIPVKEAKKMQSCLKNSEFKVIEKAGHTLNLEAIPQLASAIRHFSESV